jgi:hypothetical protein
VAVVVAVAEHAGHQAKDIPGEVDGTLRAAQRDFGSECGEAPWAGKQRSEHLIADTQRYPS